MTTHVRTESSARTEATTPSSIEIGDADRYRLQLENFAAAVRGEGQPVLDRADAVGQAKTIAALYRSAETAMPQAP